MKTETKIRRTKRNETLRAAKRCGRRIYPAYHDGDNYTSEIFADLGNGNGYILPAQNSDNA